MCWTLRGWVAATAASLVLAAVSADAQGTAADYDRALGLRERWHSRVDGMEPPNWNQSLTTTVTAGAR